MGKLFKKVPDAQRRSLRIPILVSQDEKDQLTALAACRQLPVADYLRRTGLQRKADIHFDVEIVLALSDLTRALRELHGEMLRQNTPPPADLMRQLIEEASLAMQRISK